MTDRSILVAGANGRLGRTVLAALGTKARAGVRRPQTGTDDILIDSDGQVDPARLRGVRAIINCAGVIDGSREALERGNVVYPANLAATARRCGVADFVQLSSFAVYGRAELIGRDTPIAPDSDYGRSKLEAERRLHALSTPDFRVVSLRVPFIFSAEHPGLLGRLVSSVSRLHVLPTLAGRPSRRSVITYGMAAGLLIEQVAEGGARASPGTPLCAADPVDLDLATLAETLRTRLGRRVAVVPVPHAAARAIEVLAPRLGNRLFRSSILDPAINVAAGCAEHPAERELSKYLDTLQPPALGSARSPTA